MGALVRCASLAFVHIMLLREALANLMEGDSLVTFNGKEVCRVASLPDAVKAIRELQPNVLNPVMSVRIHEGRLKLVHDTGGIYRPLIASVNSESSMAIYFRQSYDQFGLTLNASWMNRLV